MLFMFSNSKLVRFFVFLLLCSPLCRPFLCQIRGGGNHSSWGNGPRATITPRGMVRLGTNPALLACISNMLKHFSACISTMLQHFFACAFLLYSSTACVHFYYAQSIFLRAFLLCSSTFLRTFLLCSSTFSMCVSIVLQHFLYAVYCSNIPVVYAGVYVFQ